MPQLNQKTSKFEIRRELAKGPNLKANVYDRQALIDLWNQYPFEDITEKLVRKYINENDDVQATPFVDWLKANNQTMEVSEPFIRYKKIGRSKTHFRVLRTTSAEYPGLQHREFELVLNTDLFKPGSKIGPEESFEFIVTVQSGPENYGDGYKYKVVYHSTDPSAYFPTQFLREGVRWVSAGGASFSERSLDWGPVMLDHGHSVLVYQIPLFNAAYEAELTDEAIVHKYTNKNSIETMSVNYVYNIDPVGHPDMPKTTISDAELRIKATMQSNMERDLLFGRTSFPIPDSSTGLFRKTGAGILNQMEDGNIYKYSKSNFRIQEVTDYLDTVFNSPGGNVEFMVGKEALKLVDRAIRREYGEHTFIETFEEYVEKTGKVVPGGVDAWKLKRPMFTAYELGPWGVVEFKHQPWMDNRDWRGPKDPISGAPALSFHMIANKRYGKGMDSNVKLVTRPEMEVWAFQGGVVGPNGSIDDRRGGMYRSTHGGRYGHIRHQKEYGAFVENIHDFVWFKPNWR